MGYDEPGPSRSLPFNSSRYMLAGYDIHAGQLVTESRRAGSRSQPREHREDPEEHCDGESCDRQPIARAHSPYLKGVISRSRVVASSVG